MAADYWVNGFQVRPPAVTSPTVMKVVQTFIAANTRLLPRTSALGIGPKNLDFKRPATEVKHAALADNLLAIAVNAHSSDFIGIGDETAIGILGHEYGHVFYTPANTKARATKAEEEEADYFAAYIVTLLGVPIEAYRAFLAKVPDCRDEGYPTPQETRAAFERGRQRALDGLPPAPRCSPNCHPI